MRIQGDMTVSEISGWQISAIFMAQSGVFWVGNHPVSGDNICDLWQPKWHGYASPFPKNVNPRLWTPNTDTDVDQSIDFFEELGKDQLTYPASPLPWDDKHPSSVEQLSQYQVFWTGARW